MGSIDGHEGSLVFRREGTQGADSVDARLVVVEGLGAGALETVTGDAVVSIQGQSPNRYGITLMYDT
ncbi:DUF3224 domain-containing protein [Rhodococcus sp. G-MC3]|uniref:DUF3224 domain-containing protein n=1 Tax=Rhodococcus sp. G-MC3 TaxID=3046209 RepID=UPI0024B99805|nr:DUF3224 domain-containing protein [Rhodococcus sp. G-MC3]MDJ0391879.1 DUF3224 domain-containing protein [Rhodococcus sp. G-MC3]